MISHWDELESERHALGHIAAVWTKLSVDSRISGLNRIQVEAGKWSTPLHVEGSEEEIFYVLGGSGLSVQCAERGEPEAFDVGPGDCLVHLPGDRAHTLLAGDDGLDVLAFGERHLPFGSTKLPRAGMAWGLGSWVPIGAREDHPWKKEAAAGPVEMPAVSPRPARIVNVADVAVTGRRHGSVAGDWRDLGTAAGSERIGLSHATVDPGMLANPPHCHSAEEEIFVVLAGNGELELWPSLRRGGELEHHRVRPGSTVVRRAGTTRAHAFRAGDDGLTLLAYGNRDPNDVVHYPRSGKISLRGVGVIGRLEQLDYWDGEE